MIDENPFDNIDVDPFDNMPIQLECYLPECDKGPGGATWKTPALSEENALKLLDRHEQLHMKSKMVEVQHSRW